MTLSTDATSDALWPPHVALVCNTWLVYSPDSSFSSQPCSPGPSGGRQQNIANAAYTDSLAAEVCSISGRNTEAILSSKRARLDAGHCYTSMQAYGRVEGPARTSGQVDFTVDTPSPVQQNVDTFLHPSNGLVPMGPRPSSAYARGSSKTSSNNLGAPCGVSYFQPQTILRTLMCIAPSQPCFSNPAAPAIEHSACSASSTASWQQQQQRQQPYEATIARTVSDQSACSHPQPHSHPPLHSLPYDLSSCCSASRYTAAPLPVQDPTSTYAAPQPSLLPRVSTASSQQLFAAAAAPHPLPTATLPCWTAATAATSTTTTITSAAAALGPGTLQVLFPLNFSSTSTCTAAAATAAMVQPSVVTVPVAAALQQQQQPVATTSLQPLASGVLTAGGWPTGHSVAAVYPPCAPGQVVRVQPLSCLEPISTAQQGILGGPAAAAAVAAYPQAQHPQAVGLQLAPLQLRPQVSLPAQSSLLTPRLSYLGASTATGGPGALQAFQVQQHPPMQQQPQPALQLPHLQLLPLQPRALLPQPQQQPSEPQRQCGKRKQPAQAHPVRQQQQQQQLVSGRRVRPPSPLPLCAPLTPPLPSAAGPEEWILHAVKVLCMDEPDTARLALHCWRRVVGLPQLHHATRLWPSAVAGRNLYATACLWVAIKLEEKRRAAPGGVVLSHLAGTTPGVLGSAELAVMGWLGWRPYEGYTLDESHLLVYM